MSSLLTITGRLPGLQLQTDKEREECNRDPRATIPATIYSLLFLLFLLSTISFLHMNFIPSCQPLLRAKGETPFKQVRLMKSHYIQSFFN